MIYALLATNFSTLALLGYVIRETFKRLDARDLSHRGEIAALTQARMEETANLLQRIQAPEQAVATHVAESAPADPPPANLENDMEMFELYEQRLQNTGVLSG